MEDWCSQGRGEGEKGDAGAFGEGGGEGRRRALKSVASSQRTRELAAEMHSSSEACGGGGGGVGSPAKKLKLLRELGFVSESHALLTKGRVACEASPAFRDT